MNIFRATAHLTSQQFQAGTSLLMVVGSLALLGATISAFTLSFSAHNRAAKIVSDQTTLESVRQYLRIGTSCDLTLSGVSPTMAVGTNIALRQGNLGYLVDVINTPSDGITGNTWTRLSGIDLYAKCATVGCQEIRVCYKPAGLPHVSYDCNGLPDDNWKILFKSETPINCNPERQAPAPNVPTATPSPTVTSTPAPTAADVKIYRYRNTATGVHQLTMSITGAPVGYTLEGPAFTLPQIPTATNQTRLYNCSNISNGSYWAAANPTCGGHAVLGIYGWMYTTAQPATVQLHRCVKSTAPVDYITTVSLAECSNPGYVFSASLGWVLP